MLQNAVIVRAKEVIPAFDLPSIQDGAVVISGEQIIEVGLYSDLSSKYPNADEIGGSRFLLIPGLINGHGHGRGITHFQCGTLDNSLESWIWHTRSHMKLPVYDDVMYGALQLLKSGVTTTMHNHILKKQWEYQREFDECLRVYSDVGMRVLFCPSIKNKNMYVYGDNEKFIESLSSPLRNFLLQPTPTGSLDGENFVEVVRDIHLGYGGPLRRIGFGPLAPQWCSTGLLVEVKTEAERLGLPVHIHALETPLQHDYGLKGSGRSMIQWLKDRDLLGSGLVIGHGVWVTEKDIEWLAESRTGVVHNPSSNLRLRSGIAPVVPMVQHGVRVGLGLDGNGINDRDDMLQELRLCSLLHRTPAFELGAPYLTSRQIFQMVTENNAALLGFGNEIGRLEPGKYADLVLLDYDGMCSPVVDRDHDPLDVLLYRGLSKHVHTVFVNGSMVIQNGLPVHIDEAALCDRLYASATRAKSAEEIETEEKNGGTPIEHCSLLQYTKCANEVAEVSI